MILRDGQNSLRTCLHAPHGGAGAEPEEAIQSSLQLFLPSRMAANAATRSAQMVNPKEAFSILHPEKIVPSVDARAAPTAK